MVAVGVFYPIAMNTMTGVHQINPIYLDVGRENKSQPLERVLDISAARRSRR